MRRTRRSDRQRGTARRAPAARFARLAPRRSRRSRQPSAAASARSASTSTCRRTSPCSARGRSRTPAAARSARLPRPASLHPSGAQSSSSQSWRDACSVLRHAPRRLWVGVSRLSGHRLLLGGVPLGVGALELESVPGRERSGRSSPSIGSSTPSKSNRLDAGVVVEVLEVAQRRDRAARMSMDRRAAVRRELERARLAERRHPQKAGDALAAGDVGLQAVDRAGGEHPLEVGSV